MNINRKYIILAITALILGILLWHMDIPLAIEKIQNADFGCIVLATCLSFFFPLLCAIRWNIICNCLGAHLGLWESIKIIMAAWPLASITPAKSGDLIKILFLKNILTYSHTTGVILAERIMDFVALCLYAFVWSAVFGLWDKVIIAAGLLGGVLAFFLVAASPLVQFVPGKWRSFCEQILEASQKMCMDWRPFFWIVVVSLLNWFLSFLQTWLCYRAFGVDLSLYHIMAVMPFAIFIGLIPITLSGMGTRDTAIYLLFRNLVDASVTKEIHLMVGFLYSIFGYWLLSLLGLPFLKAALQGAIGGVKGEDLRKIAYNTLSNPTPVDSPEPSSGVDQVK